MLPITHTCKYRILYADTDMMGVIYYGNYGRLYEMGRTEMIREMGMPYIELENQGIVMPVFSVEAKYRKVLKYDELITIHTTVKDLPGARMEFFHKIHNEEGLLAHEATVVLVFLNTHTNRPVRAPEALVKLLQNYSG